MTEEERLVSQIRDFLRSYEQEKTPVAEELADRYAELCMRINERLIRCNDFLEKGLRSEAVQEAQAPPPLLQLVDTVNFQEVTRWRTLCGDLGLNVPPPLRMDIVDRLREECDKEEFLAPLLQTYRRLVHEGASEECIGVLRQIRELDPDNPVWTENLIPLETRQIEHLAADARRALEENDLDLIREIFEDLTDPRRVVEPPRDLVRKLEDVLRRHRKQKAFDEGERIAHELTRALEGEDYDRVGDLLARWHRLCKYPDFHPTGSMHAIATRARSWFDQETARRKNEREFQDALSHFRELVQQPMPDAGALHAAWRRLHAFGRPLPEGVSDAYGDACERLRRAAIRRRRRRIALVGLCAVLISALATAVGLFAWRTARTRRLIHRIQALERAGDDRALAEFLSRLQREQPNIFMQPTVQQAAEDLRRRNEERRMRLSEFAQVMQRLNEIRSAGYDLPDTQIRSLVERAERLAGTPETAAQIKGWRYGWELWKKKRQQDIEERFNRLILSLSSAIEASKQQQGKGIAAEGRAIEEARESLRQAEALADQVSPVLRERLRPLKEKFNAWNADYEARVRKMREQEQRKQRILRVLDSTLPDLAAFESLIRGFLDDFPKAPEAAFLRRALQEMPMYYDAVLLQQIHISRIPLPSAEKKMLSAILQRLPPDVPSIWKADIQRALAVTNAVDGLRERLADLRKLEFADLYVFYARRKGTENWEPLYYPGQLHHRQVTLPDGRKTTLYWGQVWRSTPEEPEPWLEHIKISDAEYDIRIRRTPEANLTPAARFIRELLSARPNQEAGQSYDLFLLETMKRLIHGEKDMAPVPRAILIQRIGRILASTLGGLEPAIQPLDGLFRDVPLNINWLNRTHPDVVAAEQKIQQALLSVPDIEAVEATVRANRNLLTLALGRRIRCAGMVRIDRTSGAPQCLMRAPDAAEAWIITTDPSGNRRIFLRAATRDASGNLRLDSEVKNKLFFGQVLFTPSDLQRTEDVLDACLPPKAVPTFRPAAWPVNVRTRGTEH